ncbi:hypothetical protein ABN063_05730 [Providencia vermicola]|uniref:hypothetical protein n=1 Tax=Providencia vermicola TaxID=333965 RepID=UPI0032DBAEEF
MKKIGDVTSTADKNGEFTDGNVAAGIPPTRLMGGWFNSLQREILNVLKDAGVNPSPEKDDQLVNSIKKIIDRVTSDLAGKTKLISWKYTAKGNESTLSPPYAFDQCLFFLNGLEQYSNYSFTIDNNVIYLAEPLKSNELLEVLINVPLGNTRVFNGDIQQQLEALERRVNNLTGKDFISSDEKNLVKAGSDEGIYISENELQHIDEIDVTTQEKER